MEQVGWADSIALRGIFAEHVLSSDSQTTFSPPNNPELVCTPERELFFVVGKDGIDTATWEIKPDAHPTYEASAMVSGRNAEHMAKLKEAATPAPFVDELMGFETFTDLIGLPEIPDLEQRFPG